MSELPSSDNDLGLDVLDELNKEDKDTLDLTTPIKDKDKKPDDKKPDDKKQKAPGEVDDDGDEDDKEDDEEEIDELKELEDELEDPDVEKLELSSPVPRREILKKYPELFKDFPYLEKAYYREQQFTKVFPTIEEAQSAQEQAQILERYSKDMIEEGNTHNVLKMIKDNNPETFNRVVDNYLEHLAQVDEGAYHHVLGNVIKHTIIGMVNEAKESGDDDLRVAA